MKKHYIFNYKRLDSRNWLEADMTEFTKMDADVFVLEHLPKPLTESETQALVYLPQDHYKKK